MLIHVTAPLIDPLDKVKSVKSHYLNATIADKPKPSDPLDSLPGCHTLELKLENGAATRDRRSVTIFLLLSASQYLQFITGGVWWAWIAQVLPYLSGDFFIHIP